jgi:hypothetical protein
MIPEPTTVAVRRSDPTVSALNRRDSETVRGLVKRKDPEMRKWSAPDYINISGYVEL